MKYIKVKFIDGDTEKICYQESSNGQVICYKDLDGNVTSPGPACSLVDVDCPFPSWGIVEELPPIIIPKSQEQIYNELLENGYFDIPTQIKLKTSIESQNTIANYITLLNVGIKGNQITENQMIDVDDFNDGKKYLTVTDFFGLAFRFGLYCKQIFNQRPK